MIGIRFLLRFRKPRARDHRGALKNRDLLVQLLITEGGQFSMEIPSLPLGGRLHVIPLGAKQPIRQPFLLLGLAAARR